MIPRGELNRASLNVPSVKLAEIVVNTNFQGIFLDQHLDFVFHINAVVRKLNFLLMMLRFL